MSTNPTTTTATRQPRRTSTTRAAIALIAALGATMVSASAARADGTFPAYHSANTSCIGSIFDISPDVVTAFRSSPNRPETIYWTAWLQKQSPTGAWVTLSGSEFPWTSFPAAYNDPARGTVYGALIGQYLPHWWPGSGTYRFISRFYWSAAGIYSAWEPSKACQLSSF